MMYSYGIDLGTTYSCIARADDKGTVEVIKNLEGKNITPSVVEFISPSEIVVGETAKGDAILSPDNVCLYIKRDMGKHGETREYHGQSFTPEQISALVLKKLVEDAEKMTGDKITDVVITVPAYFGFDERQATENAGKIAGLNVLAIVNEPTAAAIAYGANNKTKDDKVILVYDLGGGTFDVTVAEVADDKVTVISTEGNHTLGGKDWDAELMSYLVTQFSEKTGTPQDEIYEDSETLNELVLKTEEAKKDLTNKSATSFSLSMGRGKRAKLDVTVEKFEELTAHHLLSTIVLTRETLKQAATKTSSKGKPCDKFDEILLVGGSTRMRQVKEAMKKEFGVEPLIFEPDEAVARGAALLAQFIKANPPTRDASGRMKSAAEQRFGEVTSKSYGVEALYDGNAKDTKLSHVLLKNGEIPCSRTNTYYTIEANVQTIPIIVYESNVTDEWVELSFGKRIAEGILSLPPRLPAETPIDVTFSLDRNGLLDITAIERSKGAKCHITVKTEGLSESEVSQLQSRTSMIKMSDGI